MSIYGIGTDIISVKRIRSSIKKKFFVKRIYSKNEVLKCKKSVNQYNCYAKRFAAKEAFSKAIGTGFSKGINFNEITVLNNISGKPYINLKGETKKKIKKIFKQKKFKISLSLSDEKDYAVAFVTITV
tara:strand:- start:123 stop:506 length:384 start_codon:yes stop_codon:yes gene_type:complete